MQSSFKSIYRERYPHPRWQVCYGRNSRGSSFALTEAVRGIQSQVPYLVAAVAASGSAVEPGIDHQLVIGTREEHPVIAELAAAGKLDIPSHPEGFALWCGPHPRNPELKMIAIGGASETGIQHGVAYFNAEIVGFRPEILEGYAVQDFPPERLEQLRHAPEWQVSEAPRIQERGIWTWGYPIYDYRGFLDNMARLRLNTLILWNDRPPVNLGEVVDYAVDRHIQVIPGFHWGWGTKLDLNNSETTAALTQYVLRVLREDYRGIPLKSLYFQTLTETLSTAAGERSTAETVCELVNRIGGEVLKHDPELRILFGIHAISVQENYTCFEQLDPRISLVWEDAGVIPYQIEPVLHQSDSYRGWYSPMNDLPKTIEYSRRLARLRQSREFMMVGKGFPNIHWAEFENHRGFVLGARTPAEIRAKLESRRAHWNRSDRLWRENYTGALEFYRSILAERPGRTQVTLLIEDGMFEAAIHDGPAMAAAMLWNPDYSDEYYLRYCCNDYYAQMKLD